MQFSLPAEEDTARLARQMGAWVQPGDCLTLHGPLGAGKSAFARALIRSLLGPEAEGQDIPSPTYTLVQSYETTRGLLWHADLFRLGDPDETLELGLADAFETDITLIEWPDRLGPYLPARRLELSFTIVPNPQAAQTTADTDPRTLDAKPVGPGWDWLDRLAA